VSPAEAGEPGRTVLVSGNWKMNENHFEALRLVQELAAMLRVTGVPDGREVSIHPPFTSLRTVQTAVETDKVPVVLGAQSCHQEVRGAFTGEVSAEMLAKLNVVYVIAGHSERRMHCGETDALVRAKVDAILVQGMRPIVCVGEVLEQRQSGRAEAHVRRQVLDALSGRSAETIGGVVIAYEPIWAIGTGQTASVEDAEQMCAVIRDEVAKLAGPGAAASVRIQYGGSVTPESAGALLDAENIDGLLVGGASLDAERFVSIVRASR
jgi:triosephosphate isomerase